ncbi:MAG: nucleoside deaminase [Candidatus Gastranaerophilales bacterium]|nr:nucleoside deaminase [Candidatus Gastranaerophilales bacterium]
MENKYVTIPPFSKKGQSDDETKIRKTILNLHKETRQQIEHGFGPFLAAIYDERGNLIAKKPNSVITQNDCTAHAEINTIREAQRILDTYDLAPYNLSIFINAEPCIMCVGAIMWSGIKKVYYSVKSKDVERITGFDEGFKPNWQEEFTKRGIQVFGGIEEVEGQKVLQEYVNSGKTIYKPSRESEVV